MVDECDRCGIKNPITHNVHFGTLCPNCLYLRQNSPDEFAKAPKYGPLVEEEPEPPVPTLSTYIRDRRPGWPNPVNPYAY